MSSDQQRDWDKELAQIDKIIAQSPPTTGAPARNAPGGGGRVMAAGGAPPPAPRRAVLGTWLRVLLAVGLAVGMTQWPYFHACGTSLYLYLGALGLTVATGLWGALASWRRRIGLAHTVSLVAALWGGALLASEILPRIGYAKRAAVWSCP